MQCKCFQKGEKSNTYQYEHWGYNLGRALVITCCAFKEKKSLGFCTWCHSPPQAHNLARGSWVQQVLFLLGTRSQNVWAQRSGLKNLL